MTLEWVNEMIKKCNEHILVRHDEIVQAFKDCDFLTEEEKNKCIVDFLSRGDHSLNFFEGYFQREYCWNNEAEDIPERVRWLENLDIAGYETLIAHKDYYTRYLDSEPMEFNGDIIITDPCYIMRAKHHGTEPLTEDDWYECQYGSDMEVFDFTDYMTRDTLYGDWSCTVFDTNKNTKIGEFCADTGLVSVFLLDEVLKYNPDFDCHINNNWTTTWIKNFKGTVQFVVKAYRTLCTEEDEWTEEFVPTWEEMNSSQYIDFAVKVVGHGVDSETGERIDFIGKQTGL